jgi:hypothetical protein
LGVLDRIIVDHFWPNPGFEPKRLDIPVDGGRVSHGGTRLPLISSFDGANRRVHRANVNAVNDLLGYHQLLDDCPSGNHLLAGSPGRRGHNTLQNFAGTAKVALDSLRYLSRTPAEFGIRLNRTALLLSDASARFPHCFDVLWLFKGLDGREGIIFGKSWGVQWQNHATSKSLVFERK